MLKKKKIIQVTYSLTSTQTKMVEGSSFTTIYVDEFPFILVNQKTSHTLIPVDRVCSIFSDKKARWNMSESKDRGVMHQ